VYPLQGTLILRKPMATAAIGLLGLVGPLCSQAQNIISTYAGGGVVPSGVAPASVDLPGPTSAIRDAAGNTYIAAPYSTYVFELMNSGTMTTFAGVGYGGYGGDNGPASKATLTQPTGLAIDSKGNIYIVDPGNSRVRIVNPSGTITTFAGSGTKCEPTTALCGDGGPATSKQAAFNLPQGIAFDSAGNAYIADSFDNRIRKVDTSGNLSTYVGTGNACNNPTAKCGDGGPPGDADLNYPEGVAVDTAGNLYIADTRDNRIRMVTPPGPSQTITTVVGTGSPCQTPAKGCGDGGAALTAKLHMPTSVLLDSSNNVYIADSSDFRVRAVNMQNGNITVFGLTIKPGDIATVAGTGTQGYSGNGGAATSAQVNFPNGVFLDSTGNLIISDMGNQVVRQVAPAGSISWLAGGGSGGDNGAANQAVLANPFNVGEDSSGNLYIADTANNRIRAVNTQINPITVYGVMIQPGQIATVAGNGLAGRTGDGGPATAATLYGPTGVAIDASNNLFIADAGNLVVRKMDASGIISTYAGNGSSCNGNKCGVPGSALDVSFDDPQAVAVDNAGNLYIVDYTVNQVRKVDPSQYLTNFAGTGNTGLQCVPSGVPPPVPATSANLNHPSGITVDNAGNVYIDDSYANEVCKVDTSGTITLYTFNGAGHWAGDGGPALNASQWNPLELSVDPGGALFIGGGNNSCIRRVDPLTYTIGTVAGDVGATCVGGFAGDGGPATSAKIEPQGLVVDGQSDLYIADNANDRIRSVHLSPAITLTPSQQINFGAWPIGQTSTPQMLTIQSSGGVDLSLNSFSPIGGKDPHDFAQTGTTCGTLPANFGVDMTCTVSFTFTPATYGPRTATFTITDNDPSSPQTITLSGDGPYFTVNASPNSLTIKEGSQGTSTITLTVNAGFSQSVNLSVKNNTCPTLSQCTISPVSIMQGQSATLTIVVNQDAPVGKYTVSVIGQYEAIQSQANIKVTIEK
jgi:trimeric autotransporter adhesin